MRAALRVIDVLCAGGAWLAALACAALAIMLIVEVALTSLAGRSQPYVVEYATYFQSIVLFAGSGWTLRQGAHIRVNLLLGSVRPSIARRVDALTTAFALGLATFLAWAMIEQAAKTAALGTVSAFAMATPLAYPQVLFTAGFVLLALALAARLTRIVIGEAPDAPDPTLAAGGHE